MEYKRVLLLANSRKTGGRCLAGREILNGAYAGWLRPIGHSPTEELNAHERQYDGGAEPQALDLVDIPLIRHKPHSNHNENWLVDAGKYFVKAGTANWNQASALAETPRTLWLNGDSTRAGYHDQISQELFPQLNTSLTLIRVPSVEVRIIVPGADFGDHRRKVQARFEYNNVNYWLSLTDYDLEQRYLSGAVPEGELGECLLTISLSEPHEKRPGAFYQYKLVAALLER